ncbi:major facilitator superfamily domain-containing protein 6-like [Clytia hemisphaerica]
MGDLAEEMPLKNLNDENDEEGGEIKKYKWYNINWNTLPAKAAFFFDTARRVGSLPSLVLFLTGIGLDKVEAGLILGFRLLGMLFGGPFWGVIADKFHCHRLILIINCIGIILTMGCQPLLAIKYGNPVINKCPEPTWSQFVNNLNQTNNSTLDGQSINQKQDMYGTPFFVFFFTQILAAFFEVSGASFIDVATIRKSQLSKHRKIDYGRQRFWGPIGAIFGVNMTNLIIDYFPKVSITCYSGLFVTYVLFTILMTVCLLVLYNGLSFEDENHTMNEKEKQCFRKTFRRHLIQFEVILVYGIAFFGGVVYSSYKVLNFLYLKELSSPSLVRTLTISIAGFSAIFGFFFSGKIIRILGGPLISLMVALIFFVVRYLGYTFAPTGWILLAFQPLHFLSFVLFVTSAITYVKETSPLIVITSMVSLFQTMFEGVGVLVGSSIGGVLFKNYGGRKVYLIYAFFALFWAMVLGVYIFIFKDKNKNTTKSEKNDESTTYENDTTC